MCIVFFYQSSIQHLAASFGCKAASLSKLACIIKHLWCIIAAGCPVFLIFVSIEDACFRERLLEQKINLFFFMAVTQNSLVLLAASAAAELLVRGRWELVHKRIVTIRMGF